MKQLTTIEAVLDIAQRCQRKDWFDEEGKRLANRKNAALSRRLVAFIRLIR